MHKREQDRMATQASDAPNRARFTAARRRSRGTIVGFLAAIAIVAAGFGSAVSVDVPTGGDADTTSTAFAHSTWGATWS